MPTSVRIQAIVGGGTTPPSTASQNIFTGATIPLTYLNNTITYENVYEYKSNTHDITITGLDTRATITGNGTKSVSVSFDVTSSTSSLKNFTITCVKDTETLTYNGLHAHYGTNVTGILTFAYKNITKDGSEGTIGTEYLFISTASDSLPIFSSATTIWNNIYSYQLLNTLIGNYSSTSIGAFFLQNCFSFNQPLTIPNTVTSIGHTFMNRCYSFNQPLTISTNIKTINNNFLRDCTAFNQPLTIHSGITSIGIAFLASCYSFNQPLTLPSGITSIEDLFLDSCYSFNQPLTLPSSITSIGNYFLSYCYSFNQPLTIPSSITIIKSSFLRYCYSFNQPITIPSNVTSIGTFFLQNCYSFNQPLTIPSNVTSISSSFLYNCYAFNKPLTIHSGITSINSGFLQGCYSFNQPITIPSNVTTVGTTFMNNCYSLSTINYNASVYPTDTNSLSQDTNSKTSTSGAGIKVYGTNRAGLMSALPNSTVTPFRKLVDGGS